MKFAIVGGGIGGLTLAIALQRKGYDVTIYESAPEIKPLGAGLVLAANAMRALAQIGIHDNIRLEGNLATSFQIKSQRGKILNAVDSERIGAKYGTHSFTIHRADLHRTLINLLQGNVLKLGKSCVNIDQDASGVSLYFADGTQIKADYVFAFDGIHSRIRRKLLPSITPRYAGYTCWRAVIDNLPGNSKITDISETWGAAGKFGIVPLSRNRIYWFACINSCENNEQFKAYTPTDLLKHFHNYHDPIPSILSHTSNEQLIWNDIIDIKPINRFLFDRILLLGDAAHATTPNMGQGACMAIEDAVVLANCIANTSTLHEGLQQFETKRIDRTTEVVNRSWTLGKITQLQNPLLITLRNIALRLTPERASDKQMDFLYDISFND